METTEQGQGDDSHNTHAGGGIARHRKKHNDKVKQEYTSKMSKNQNMNKTRSNKLRYCLCHPCIKCLYVAGALFVIGLLLFPLCFKITPLLMQKMVIQNSGSASVGPLKDYGLLPGARNFYIKVQENIEIGVWHILPNSLSKYSPSDELTNQTEWFEHSLHKQHPIVVYLHGTKGSRAGAGLGLYDVFRTMDYHIIAFNYRGYGDSSAVQPTEEGLVNDTIAVYHYLRSITNTTDIYIWGHSLGTGVATHAVADLCRTENCPSGMILESPFNSMADEVRSQPLVWMISWLPYFEWAMIGSLTDGGIEFASEDRIKYVTTNILILHAEDDLVVPFQLGKSLYNTGLETRNTTDSPISMIAFDAKYKYHHMEIYRAPELPAIFMCKMRRECSEFASMKHISNYSNYIRIS